MKKKNLLFTLTLASILSTATLASCGGQKESKTFADFTVPEGGFDTENEVTITFYSTMGDTLQGVFDVYLEEFNELYPNITVEHTPIGGYDDVRDQIKTEVSNGIHPNLAYCYSDHVALYNKAKAVIRLDNLIKDETYGFTKEQIDDFIPGYYNEGKEYGDSHMYTLPFSKSTEVLYYNKTFFDEHNLKVPTTWAEMEEVCKKIKEIDPTCFPLGYDSEANWFITMCAQYGSNYVDAQADSVEGLFTFNNKENKEFVSMFKRWYDLGYFTTQSLYGSYTSGLFVETSASAQKSYMSIGSSAGANHQVPAKDDSGAYPFEVSITSIPQVDVNNPKAISQGPSICIFNDEDPQKVLASWLLLKFLTTNVGFQAEFGKTSGYVPVIKSVAEDPTYSAFLSNYDKGNAYITALAAKVCLEQEEAYFTTPAFVGSSEARDQVGSLMTSVFSNTKSVDEAFEYAVSMCIANS